MHHYKSIALLCLSLGLGLSACGGKDNAAPVAATTTTAAQAIVGVIPTVDSGIAIPGTFDLLTMTWVGTANGTVKSAQGTLSIANPTSSFVSIQNWTDGTPTGASGAAAPATVRGSNKVLAFTDSATSSLSAATVSRDGQFMATADFLLNVQEGAQGAGVLQPATPHTAATVAGAYNIIGFQRQAGATSVTTDTFNGTMIFNPNGTYSVSGNGTTAGLPNQGPFTVNTGTTFTVSTTGVITAKDSTAPTEVSTAVLSADGNYLVSISQDPVSRLSKIIIGFKQHNVLPSYANSSLNVYHIGRSTTANGIFGFINIATANASSVITDQADSENDNGTVCGIPGQANCQLQISSSTIAPSGLGAVTITDSAGVVLHGYTSASGDVMIFEDPAQSLTIVFKQ